MRSVVTRHIMNAAPSLTAQRLDLDAYANAGECKSSRLAEPN